MTNLEFTIALSLVFALFILCAWGMILVLRRMGAREVAILAIRASENQRLTQREAHRHFAPEDHAMCASVYDVQCALLDNYYDGQRAVKILERLERDGLVRFCDGARSRVALTPKGEAVYKKLREAGK